MKKNTIEIILTLTEQGVKRFKTVPTFRDLLHTNQRESLIVGQNALTVNNTVWGSLQRVVSYDSENMSVQKSI